MKQALVVLFSILISNPVMAQVDASALPLVAPSAPLPQALSRDQIKRLTDSVDRGLIALTKLQSPDGSFGRRDHVKPAITSLTVMAFLSRGHKPGEGPYGDLIDKGINYVLTVQQKSGLFAAEELNYPLINRIPSSQTLYTSGGATKTYCHAISMLMLGEVYGLTDPLKAFRVREGIIKGLKCTLQLWDIRKGRPADDGGFRYPRPWSDRREGDISITGWHAASLRSIRNAGFDVPQSIMDRIANYVIRNQNGDGGFGYIGGSISTIAMTSAGSLCIALAGKHQHVSLNRSSNYLKRFSADSRRSFTNNSGDYYPYYTCYYVTQTALQMGGSLWIHCMNECYRFLIPKQQASGLWQGDGYALIYGPAYSTSMSIIALTPPLQLLPIYQR